MISTVFIVDDCQNSHGVLFQGHVGQGRTMGKIGEIGKNGDHCSQ